MQTHKRVWLFLAVLLISSGVFIGLATAAVTGECVNCHTMHNSQDGASVAGQSQSALLKDDCVGCHSSSGTETVVSLGTSKVPIVYNTNGTTTPLAAGNFYWVVGDDNRGHNIFSIAGQDATHTLEKGAPGGDVGSNSSSCTPCHSTLAADNPISGCRGCHLPMHHADDSTTVVSSGPDGWYRFLGSAMSAALSSANPGAEQGVTGIEDSDWERTSGPDDHNIYKGTLRNYANSYFAKDGSIGSFCSGCHGIFHSAMTNGSGAWIRHPSDVALDMITEGSEYADYSYTTLAPVAYTDLAAIDTSRPLVTCLSCHRAHGSPNADMLRWDYDTCVTNTENNDCGCFACHTTKDGEEGFVP